MLHTIYQPNITCNSGEKVDFIDFAIFSTGGHLGFLTILNFSILKPYNLVMLHVNLRDMDAVVSETKSFKWT